MTIECYYSQCKYHDDHWPRPDKQSAGPFCSEKECRQPSRMLRQFATDKALNRLDEAKRQVLMRARELRVRSTEAHGRGEEVTTMVDHRHGLAVVVAQITIDHRYVQDWHERPFRPGEVISYQGSYYKVVRNYGQSGLVTEYPDGEEPIEFFWSIDGEDCKRVRL